MNKYNRIYAEYKVRKIVKEMDGSQRAKAKALGVGRSPIAEATREDYTVSLNLILAVANRLDLSLDYLFSNKDYWEDKNAKKDN